MSLFDDEIGRILPSKKGTILIESGRDSDDNLQVPLPQPTHRSTTQSNPIENDSKNSGEQKNDVKELVTRPKIRNSAIAKRNALEAIDLLVEASIPRMQGWLDTIAEEDGAKAAMDTMLKLMEYYAPKLARSEITGAGGAPLQLQVVKFTDVIDNPVDEV